jgi:hypothetical protein
VGNGAAHARDPGTGFHRAGRGRFAAPYRAVARRGVRREWPSRARRATAPNCSARRQFPRLRRARWGPTTATPITAGTGKATESPTSPAVARFFGESTTEPASERTTVEQPETKLAHRRVLRAGGGSARAPPSGCRRRRARESASGRTGDRWSRRRTDSACRRSALPRTSAHPRSSEGA